MPENEDSYFICSHYVPMDWTWTGREEKVQITVGNRTLSVFIPEDWTDNDPAKTNTDTVNYTDDNGYRDPGEVSGISLDDLADIVNRSLEDHGADMLVKVSVEKDYENNRQQLIMKSNTGEKVGITGWPDTDYMPMPATITSNEFKPDNTSWKEGNGSTNGLMGNANLLSWKGGSGTLTITAGTKTAEVDLSEVSSSTELVEKLNDLITNGTDGEPFASLSTGKLPGRLMLNTDSGEITVTGDEDDMRALFGTSDTDTLRSTQSSLTFSTSEDTTATVKIYINQDDTLATLADRINGIEGISARNNADGKSLVVTATRIGALPSDRLAPNEADELSHYPSMTIKADGGALNIFEFGDGTSLRVDSENRQVDHSHMDVFDVLGMETAMKSREFQAGETLTVEEGTQLHWRVMSGGRTADIKLNAGEYSIETLADRLSNAGAGWLEVSISEDTTEKGIRGTLDAEAATKRLVIRGFDAEQVVFVDMNEYNYADQMGLSTALRTDGYTSDRAGTGTKCVVFPSAPCVDNNIGVPVRVQMNCGTYYDVNIKKAEVVDPKTGFVDRNKVMKAIVDGVNAQEGHDIMGYTAHMDASRTEIADSSAIYFLSGEAFTVVDMPFSDPEWYDYSSGIAAQMGIHGGITANMKQTTIPMKDNATFGEAYDEYNDKHPEAQIDFRPGTIRFSNLAHEVEIDVSENDTVKDVIDRLRTQAGDWLYVNYYDEHMGQVDTRNTGDYPLISLSSVDGSAVNVLDVKGHIAQDALGLTTGIQTRLNPDGYDEGMMDDYFTWEIDGENTDFPANTLTITVAGYSHTIDLSTIRDVTNDSIIKADDVAEFINARMQDYDIKAEINQDGELMIWSLRGYSVGVGMSKHVINNSGTLDCEGINASSLSITVSGQTYTVDISSIDDNLTSEERTSEIARRISARLGSRATVGVSGGAIVMASTDTEDPSLTVSYWNNVTSDFLGEYPDSDKIPSRSYYRGGYNLEGSAESRGIDAGDMYSTGMHGQNATIRSGANTMRQNGFGVINDVISAVNSGNRDDLTDKMLPRLDDFINNILSVMAENGALQARYSYNNERLVTENAIMDEQYDNLVKIDPADAISQLMVADYMYQANLAVISRLIQPSLLDFLS